MKRLISIILLVATLLTLASPLSGCSANKDTVLTVGQWLTMINDAFGMNSFTEEKPYFANVQSDDPYFEAVQIATEWDVVDRNGTIDVNEELRWKFALVSLVNVGNFTDIEASDEAKIDCAIHNFDTTIRKYWMNRTIEPEKAILLLATAQKQWANKEYDHVTEEVNYNQGVVDLTSVDKIDYQVKDNVVQIAKSDHYDLSVGDVYVLPQTESNPFVQVNKVESITEDENYIYIKNSDEELTLEDVAQDINIEETFVPSAENAVIYDGNGQVISVGSNVVPQMNKDVGNYSVAPLINTGSSDYQTEAFYTAQAPVQKHTFTLGDWKVNLTYQLDGALDFGVELETPNMLTQKYQKEHPTQELTASFSAKINNLKVTNKVDYKLFKLKSATLRVDYEEEVSGKLKFAGKPVNKLLAPEYRNDGDFAKNWANKVLKDADGENCKGAKTIKVCSVDIYSIGVARVCLDINFTISAEGTVSVTMTMRGAKGIEYKKGNMRLINTCDKDVDVDIKAKIEATVGVGPALYVVGLKKPIIGLQVSGGLGAALRVKFNIADNQNHLIETTSADQFSLAFAEDIQNTEIKSSAEEIKKVAEAQGCTYSIETSEDIKLHFDVCVDGYIYAIVRVSITDTSYIAEFLGNKITTSWEIFGEKNGKLITVHNDNGKFSFGYAGHPAVCTLAYVPFEEKASADETTGPAATQNNGTVLEGDSIILNQMYVDIVAGNNSYIQILKIPKGYTVQDLVCSSSDKSIAKVNSDGVITAVDIGSAVITVCTKDKKYNAYIAVTVTDGYGEGRSVGSLSGEKHVTNNTYKGYLV